MNAVLRRLSPAYPAAAARAIISVMTVPLEISAWKPAPFALGGETVFAIGDVHGCAAELKVLLDGIEALANTQEGRRRLIYLGDMINRGPDSIGVLDLWARGEEAHGVDHIDRLMGNHEIMMMLAVVGGPHAHKAETMWLSKRMGGHKLFDQMAARAGRAAAHADQALLKAGLGDDVVHRLCGWATRCSSMAASTRTPTPTNSWRGPG